MEKKYILAVDQSTSGTKAILFNHRGERICRCSKDHTQYYPQPGWVEHDAEEIYKNTLNVLHDVLCESGISSGEIDGLAVTNQRETVVVWDKETGRPVSHAVVWQCRRSAEICDRLKKDGLEYSIRDKTGLVLSPYFSASKIQWILDHVEGARQKAEAGKLLFGTMDTWLVWKLTGGYVYATDYSNASRTQLFNIYDLCWDRELFHLFSIPECMAPEVRYSDEIFGYTDLDGMLDRKIPISGVLGDSHAALFGHNCFQKGMAKATYGTGSSVMMNIGTRPIRAVDGLVTSIAWGAFGKVEYALEGDVNFSADTIKWLAEDLELIEDPSAAGPLAASVPGTGGVFFIPAFAGLGAPYWDNEARAAVTGMTRGTKKAHVVRAAEESIAYQVRDIVDRMRKESGMELKELRVDGGASRDNFLMQFQADMLDVPIVRNKISELSAFGSALLAGLAWKVWDSVEGVEQIHGSDAVFHNKITTDRRKILYRGWKEAIARIRTKNGSSVSPE